MVARSPLDVYIAQRNATLPQLRARIGEFETLGVTGVLASDHLFVPRPDQRAQGRLPHEPITTLTTIAALSERLSVGTIVSNIGFLHPALVIRQFAQMAVLFGGERIVAGLGAGWGRAEFEALGMRMPPHHVRVERLAEAARLAREMFDTGVGNMEGEFVIARDLPLAPKPTVPPRLLVGGGSDRLLDIAGRYADMLDLSGSSRRSALPGADPSQADLQRRLMTTVSDLELSVLRVREASKSTGRTSDAVQIGLLINYFEICPDNQVNDRARVITEAAGLGDYPLDECPYVMLGSRERIAAALAERRERLEVRALTLTNNIDPRPLYEQILPLLSQE
jgi:alkanesulfonate monooxygenase SsuD/methylene tetrahydromethanopterin reductase-like flavin-dependent oxidoreductase (luciferase family)